ncbi:proton-conducting transporter membrane subunit [Fimbriiglobus ruber]|uniref:NADH-ubiquinone oxidoreductase chain M n=1 Tax=Fimbriiglobus ruber TaxID=1908690 RepID=A0A225DKF2_9BACT|nr:proton-conducting transporter membrane subunit [Fimbriiglobus ruber]OWK37669.1 NADH-ubiquinone oxidoreductase chain M [Fimbriiglobus ruber]
MNVFQIPWLELAIAGSLVGALGVSRVRDPLAAARWGYAFTGAVFACTFLAWLGFYLGTPREVVEQWSAQPHLFGTVLFAVDELNAPLVPMIALLHFLTALATTRTKMRRFSFSWSLCSEGIRLALFGCTNPIGIAVILIAGTIPPYLELLNRGKPARVYAFHMILFAVLLVVGLVFADVDGHHRTQSALATVPLMAAILVRCGAVPAHCWITDWFEHASFGNALLYVTPLAGVYAAIRLVLPIAPEWVLQSISIISMVTAVYAAGMAAIQRDTRRFFAYLFVSHGSLVLVGLELVTTTSLTGALALWFSIGLSLSGFGLTLRALESRFGRLSLTRYHGLYEHSPTLAVCFLLTGLASVGFPGTLGFVSTEVLTDGAIEADLYVGLAIVLTAAINGIAVVRAYLLLFTGARHQSSVSLQIGARERFAVLVLAVMILGGGLYPQPGISTRHKAAEEILKDREGRVVPAAPVPHEEVAAKPD